MGKTVEKIITACKRCGTCCNKGGPGLHREDLPLVENGTLLLKHLYTIRMGEPAQDNLTNEILPSATDIIKIKSKNDSPACIFYDENQSSCTIYVHRPAECRALKCWDTRDIEAIYTQNRLTRNDIMGDIEGLWELVADHQKRCSFEEVLIFSNCIKRRKKIGPELENKVRYMIQYDLEIRSLVQREGNIDSEMIDFLFGRPMITTLKSLGMNVRSQNGKIILVPPV